MPRNMSFFACGLQKFKNPFGIKSKNLDSMDVSTLGFRDVRSDLLGFRDKIRTLSNLVLKLVPSNLSRFVNSGSFYQTRNSGLRDIGSGPFRDSGQARICHPGRWQIRLPFFVSFLASVNIGFVKMGRIRAVEPFGLTSKFAIRSVKNKRSFFF